jgi:hypothetical protein
MMMMMMPQLIRENIRIIVIPSMEVDSDSDRF